MNLSIRGNGPALAKGLILFITVALSYLFATHTKYPDITRFTLANTILLTSLLILIKSKNYIYKYMLNIKGLRYIFSLFLLISFLSLLLNLNSFINLILSHIFLLIIGLSLYKLISKRHLEYLIDKIIVSYFLGLIELALVALITSILLNITGWFSLSALRTTLAAVALIHSLHLLVICKKDLYITLTLRVSLQRLSIYLLFILITWVFIVLYPLMYLPFAPGLTDFSHTHFKIGVNIVRNPILLTMVYSSDYPLYHAYIGASMALSNNFDFVQNFIVLTLVQQLLLVAATVIYVRTVLKNDSLRQLLVPLTLLIFTGLGWLYLLIYPPSTTDKWFEAATLANEKTYRNIIYQHITYFWPSSFTLGITLYLLFLSIIIKYNNVEKILTILLSFSLSSIHLPESIFLSFIFTVLVFIIPISLEFIKYFIIGCLAGAFLIQILDILYVRYLLVELHWVIVYFIITFPLLCKLFRDLEFTKRLIIHLFFRFKIIPFVNKKDKIIIIIFIFYFFGILAAVDPKTHFMASRSDPMTGVGLIPWFIYPISLGFLLPFGLTGLLLDKLSTENAKIITTIIVFFSIIVGKSLSYVNLHIYTGYWGEKRFLVFIYLALLPYATSLLCHLFELVLTRIQLKKVLLLCPLISLVVVLSFGNILNYTVYWEIYSNRYILNDSERDVIQFLVGVLWQNPARWVLPSNPRLRLITNHAAPVYNTYITFPVEKLNQPEFLLLILNSYDLLNSPYFVTYRGQTNELLRAAGRKLFEVGNIEVYDLPLLTPIVRRSDTVLLRPLPGEGTLREFGYVALLLSRLALNYTVANTWDVLARNYSIWLLPFDTCDPMILKTLNGGLNASFQSMIVITFEKQSCIYNIIKSSNTTKSLINANFEVHEIITKNYRHIIYVKINNTINNILWDNVTLDALRSVLSKYVKTFTREYWGWWHNYGNVGATAITAREVIVSANSVILLTDKKGTHVCIGDACFSEIKYIQVIGSKSTPSLKAEYVTIVRGYGYYAEARCTNVTLMPQSTIIVSSDGKIFHTFSLDRPLQLKQNLTLIARDVSLTAAELIIDSFFQRLKQRSLAGKILVEGGTINIEYVQGSNDIHMLNVFIADSKVELFLLSNIYDDFAAIVDTYEFILLAVGLSLVIYFADNIREIIVFFHV